MPVIGEIAADRKEIAVESEERMAEQALSTIGVTFGWGIGTLTTPPTSWKEIEECMLDCTSRSRRGWRRTVFSSCPV